MWILYAMSAVAGTQTCVLRSCDCSSEFYNLYVVSQSVCLHGSLSLSKLHLCHLNHGMKAEITDLRYDKYQCMVETNQCSSDS